MSKIEKSKKVLGKKLAKLTKYNILVFILLKEPQLHPDF